MTNQDNQTTESDSNFESHNKDFDYLAYVLGAAVVIGAIIISATLFYNFKMLFKRLDSQSVSTQQVAAAPSAAVPTQVAPTQAAGPTGTVKVTLKSNTPYLGSNTAKVTVVEYADYECPFCERFYTSVMSDLKTKYINTGKIKFVFQDFAFLGPDSNTAGEATHCAQDQNKFWQYHDYLFTNQGQEGSGWATADHQKQFAKTLGLNTTQFNQCLDSGKYKQEVLDQTAAGKSYGISGTPSVIVFRSADTSIDLSYIQAQLQQQKSVITLPNGNVFIVGAQPAASFEQAIDAALKK